MTVVLNFSPPALQAPSGQRVAVTGSDRSPADPDLATGDGAFARLLQSSDSAPQERDKQQHVNDVSVAGKQQQETSESAHMLLPDESGPAAIDARQIPDRAATDRELPAVLASSRAGQITQVKDTQQNQSLAGTTLVPDSELSVAGTYLSDATAVDADQTGASRAPSAAPGAGNNAQPANDNSFGRTDRPAFLEQVIQARSSEAATTATEARQTPPPVSAPAAAQAASIPSDNRLETLLTGQPQPGQRAASQPAAGAGLQGANQAPADASGDLAETVSRPENGNPGGKQSPDSGKPLPAVLLQTPAHDAPGLAPRVDLMTRATGSDRGRPAVRESLEIQAGDKPVAAGLRGAMAEAVGRVVTPIQAAAGTENGLASQMPGSDSQSQPQSQPAQPAVASQGGADRAAPGRATTLIGLNSSNGFSLHVQPESPAWSSQLGNHVRWMHNLNLSTAELKLHPAELGTLEIHISAEDDQTRVSFITSNAAAKELIESSLPRLRELLGQSGLLLEQGDVTHRESGSDTPRERVVAVTPAAADNLSVEPEAA